MARSDLLSEQTSSPYSYLEMATTTQIVTLDPNETYTIGMRVQGYGASFDLNAGFGVSGTQMWYYILK